LPDVSEMKVARPLGGLHALSADKVIRTERPRKVGPSSQSR
jgi:hypothetical protein